MGVACVNSEELFVGGNGCHNRTTSEVDVGGTPAREDGREDVVEARMGVACAPAHQFLQMQARGTYSDRDQTEHTGTCIQHTQVHTHNSTYTKYTATHRRREDEPLSA